MEDDEKGGVTIPMTNKGSENVIRQEGEKAKQYIVALVGKFKREKSCVS